MARGAERAAFLTAQSLRCHGADAQQGGVRLDDLAAEIATVETAERWQKVLNAGEMPPEEEPRPDATAKTRDRDSPANGTSATMSPGIFEPISGS